MCTVEQDVANRIRQTLTQHGHLPVPVAGIDDHADLYAAGLKSFAAVQVMLALEGAFDIEIPERMLVRRTFSSIAAMAACVSELIAEKAPCVKAPCVKAGA